MAGYKSKYSPANAEKVVNGIRNGMTLTASAGLVGLTADTIYNWMKRHPAFSTQVRVAEQEAEARFTAVIAKAALGHEAKRVIKRTYTNKDGKLVTEVREETYREFDWQAARYWLGQRRRQDWGERIVVEVQEEVDDLLKELDELRGPQQAAPTLH